MTTQLLAGIAKVIEKGTASPDATRFHVPDGEGGWRQVTWGQMLERARQVALYLDHEGVQPGDKVSVYATTRVEWAYVVHAIEACRAVFVPVYFSNTPAQVHYVVDHCDAEVLFTEMALLPRVLERWDEYTKLQQVIVFDLGDDQQLDAMLSTMIDSERESAKGKITGLGHAFEIGAVEHENNPNRLNEMVKALKEDDLAAIIYTSGTTGVPKGAMLTYRNLIVTTDAWYQVLAHAIPPVGDRRDILWLPVSHMSGWGILGQGTLFDYETWLADPYNLLSVLPVARPTMLFAVPLYWEKLYTMAVNASPERDEQFAELQRLTGGAMRFLLSGGAGLKREVKDFYKDAGLQMIEGYGMTECAPNLTMNRLDDFDFDSVGKSVPGVEMKLAPDGEILVKGENVFVGYYKMPDETAASFNDDGWFCTGDLGEWTAGGFLKIIGRKKEIIATSGGKKIGPAGIESQFVGNPYVEHVVLYGNEKKYLVALITTNQMVIEHLAAERGYEATSYDELLARPEIRDLIQQQVDAVNAQLASYETIKKFYLHPGHLTVDSGQLTPSLKLRRKTVWEDFENELEALY